MPQSKGSLVAVITGTGITGTFKLQNGRSVGTRYGDARVYRDPGIRCLVLPRHGLKHNLPPHRINYRANIAALAKLGVGKIIATSAVGSMRKSFGVGSVGLLGQFIDFTKARPSTFFEDRAVHTDMTRPYSEEIGTAVEAASKKVGLRLQKGLVYVATEGPRFESAAEIRMFTTLGGDVVGMTGVPEVVLARELGMEYACIAVASNWAAGEQDTVTHGEVLRVMKKTGMTVRRLIEETVNLLQSEDS